MITFNDIALALAEVGVGDRDVLVVYSDVAYIGPVAGASGREAYLAGLWDCLREAAGERATIVMSTASTYLCETGADFILETTPCDTGVLSEYLRTRPASRRSLHPFVSYSAHGPLAGSLTARTSKSGYGAESPMEGMVAAGARALNIGIPARYAPSVVHHCPIP
jgi:aminoglycoside 3-N-acetyltransferase